MKQIDGEKDSVLTWGDLIETRSKLGNLLVKVAERQKSAEAIVPLQLENEWKG